MPLTCFDVFIFKINSQLLLTSVFVNSKLTRKDSDLRRMHVFYEPKLNALNDIKYKRASITTSNLFIVVFHFYINRNFHEKYTICNCKKL